LLPKWKKLRRTTGLCTYQHRSDNLSAMSVELYHDVFARFRSGLQSAMPADIDWAILGDLVGIMHVRYRKEDELRTCLAAALIKCLPDGAVIQTQPPWHGRYKPDLVIVRRRRRIGIVEVKRQAVSEGIAEVAAYYHYRMVRLHRNLKRKGKESAFDASNWPTLLLVAAGHHLVALGAVWTGSRAICEVLGSCLLLINRDNREAEASGVRFMAATRLALQELAALPGTEADRQPYTFPYRHTCAGITVQYRAELKPGAGWSPVYEARVTHISAEATQEPETGEPVKVGDTVVVKFVRGTYGFEAHRAMAEKGLAPQIYATEAGLWTMIIMEHVEGTTLRGKTERKWKKGTMKKLMALLSALLSALHDDGFVFGDFRLNNILVRKDGRLLLCDFDWAGRASQARYPRLLNPAIRWPEGVIKEGRIMKRHDRAWLDRYRKGDFNETLPEETAGSQQGSPSSSGEHSGRPSPLPEQGAGSPHAQRRDAAPLRRSRRRL
jgi:hypothetical protein